MSEQIEIGAAPEQAAMPLKITTADVNRYLAETYSESNGYACLFEVANGTGSNARRSADALVLNLWPSRGMELVGYEVKTSRSDWQRELKDPDKAWPVMQYCDRWFLLAAPGVAKVDEIPINWGLIEYNGTRAKAIKAAPRLPEPEPITRTFLGALLRRPAREFEEEVEIMVRKRMKKLEEDFDKRVQQGLRHGGAQMVEIKKKAEQIKAATGIDLLHGYDAVENIASAINSAMSGTNLLHTWSGLPAVVSHIETALSQANHLMEAVNKMKAADQ